LYRLGDAEPALQLDVPIALSRPMNLLDGRWVTASNEWQLRHFGMPVRNSFAAL